MSNTPTLRFGEFDGEWSEKRLGEIGKVSMCKRIMKDETSPSGDIPFYKIGTFGKQANAFINQEVYESYKSKYSYPKKGDILIAASGATYGKLVVFDGFPAYFQDSNIVWIDNNEEKVSNPFLYICYQKIRWTIEESTIPRLYNGVIRSTLITIPTLLEQQKIATFLSAVDSSIEQLGKKEQLLRSYKKGVMQKIFSREIRFKREDGGAFEDWVEKRLGNIGTFTKGKGISKNDVVENASIPCIRYGELYTKYNEIIDKVSSFTNVEKDNLVLSQSNDIIIPSSGETAIDIATASCVIHDNIALGGDLNIIRTQENGIFLSYYLNNAKKYDIAKLAQGSSVIHLYSVHLKSLKINLPSLPEQTKIANFLSSLDKQIAQVSEQLAEKKDFKKGLLQKMFV